MKNLALIIAVCCLVAGCATSRPILVCQTLTASEEEQMLWRRAQEEQNAIDGSGLLYQDTEIENYLNQIAKKLQTYSISSDISFQIKVIKDSKLNAFALPNGAIYIHIGILARMENEDQLILHMIENGVNGYLLKDCDQNELEKAIVTVMDKDYYFNYEISELIRNAYIHKSNINYKNYEFTARETEVLELICQEFTSHEIAEKLSVSIRTIETHRKNIMEKLQIHSIAELTKFAIREGLTSLDK